MCFLKKCVIFILHLKNKEYQVSKSFLPLDITECAPVIHWVVNSGVLVHVWHCVTDGESYVRASAITTLLHITACDVIQKAFYMQVAVTQVF